MEALGELRTSAGLRGELIRPEDPRWLSLLRKVTADIYHRPEYLRAATAVEEGELWIAWVSDGDLEGGVPLLLRPLPGALGREEKGWDACTPYGYPSLLSTAQTQDDWRELWSALRALMAEQGIIAAFFRLHPLLSRGPCLEAAGVSGQLVEHGPSVHLDLAQSEEALWSQTRPRFRSNINRLRRDGWCFRANDWSLLPDFIALYEQTMTRSGADRFYFFPESYYRALQEALGEAVALHGVLEPGGKLASAGLFFRQGPLVQYHLGGTFSDYLAAAPAKLLFHEVRLWYRQAGARLLHLGGGVGGKTDSLYRFKSGFSKESNPFYTLRMIIDPERYGALVAAWQERSGCVAPGPEGFFPAYRAPTTLTLP